MRNAAIIAALVGVLVCGALVALVGTALGLGGGVAALDGVFGDGGYEATTMDSFETTGPACPAERGNGTVVRSLPTAEGRQLSVSDNVSVASNATTLDASLSEVGPGRYVLSLSRAADGSENGTGSAESACAPEIRYNATMNVTRPNDYTLVVTVDGELQQVLWSESTATGGAAGASSSASAGGAEVGGGDSAGSGDTGSAGGSDADADTASVAGDVPVRASG